MIAMRASFVAFLCLCPLAKSFVGETIHLYRHSALSERLDKGFNILELSGTILPSQGTVVRTASETWKFIWKRMMAELAPQDKTGGYQRPTYPFSRSVTNLVTTAPGRYHLYTGNPCPWCHRTVLAVKYMELEDIISITKLEDNPVKASRGGWVFSGTEPDVHFGCKDLRELYDRLKPGYQGRCTAPLLVDVREQSIISNESADIVRMVNDASRSETKNLYPENLRTMIDDTNGWVYETINNGVYRCGFSTSQKAYDLASMDVREGLNRCNEILSSQAYLCGNDFSEADLRLLPTVLRFDGAYAPLFRAGGGHTRMRDYEHIQRWLNQCWNEHPAVRESIDLADACGSYYKQLFPLNPGGLMPSPPVSASLLGLE